jgi:hypothetical protein
MKQQVLEGIGFVVAHFAIRPSGSDDEFAEVKDQVGSAHGGRWYALGSATTLPKLHPPRPLQIGPNLVRPHDPQEGERPLVVTEP